MSEHDSGNYWTRIAGTRLNRRRALGGGAALSGMFALAAAGCSSSNNNSGAKPANAAATTVATTAGTAAARSAGSPAAQATIQTIGVSSATAAAAAAKPKTGGTLTLSISRDAANMDTARSQDVYSAWAQYQVVEPLVIGTNDFKIAPNTLDKIENPDNVTYLFHVRPGLKYQDGTDFNADSVKWNLQRHLDDAKSIRHQDVTPITGMQTVDATTLKITVSAPYAPFLSKLTGGAGLMYSQAAFTKLGDKIANDLTGTGTGPFKLTKWDTGNQLVFDKNPTYWKKDANGTQYPYLDKLIFKPIPDENTRLANLQTGDVDYCDVPPPKDVKSIQTNSDLTYKQVPGLGFNFVLMQTQKEPFTDKRVRQAFAYTVDRQTIADTVYFGTVVPGDTEIPPTLFGGMPGPYVKQDIAKAKALLQAAGKPSVDFTLQFSNASPTIQQACELMKASAAPAGINITLEPIYFATVVSNSTQGTNQAAEIGWSGAVDPDGFVYILFHTGAGQNLAHISDPSLDALLEKGQQTLEVPARTAIYNQVVQSLADLEPFMIFNYTAYQQATRKNVQNFQLGPSIWQLMHMVWKS